MRMSIAVRLAVGFGLVMAMSLGLALFQLSSFRTAIDYLDRVTQRDFVAYRLVVGIAHGRAQLRALRETAIIQSALPNSPSTPLTLSDYIAETQSVIGIMSELAAFSHERAADASTSQPRRERWAEMAKNADEIIVLNATSRPRVSSCSTW